MKDADLQHSKSSFGLWAALVCAVVVAVSAVRGKEGEFDLDVDPGSLPPSALAQAAQQAGSLPPSALAQAAQQEGSSVHEVPAGNTAEKAKMFGQQANLGVPELVNTGKEMKLTGLPPFGDPQGLEYGEFDEAQMRKRCLDSELNSFRSDAKDWKNEEGQKDPNNLHYLEVKFEAKRHKGVKDHRTIPVVGEEVDDDEENSHIRVKIYVSGFNMKTEPKGQTRALEIVGESVEKEFRVQVFWQDYYNQRNWLISHMKNTLKDWLDEEGFGLDHRVPASELVKVLPWSLKKPNILGAMLMKRQQKEGQVILRFQVEKDDVRGDDPTCPFGSWNWEPTERESLEMYKLETGQIPVNSKVLEQALATEAKVTLNRAVNKLKVVNAFKKPATPEEELAVKEGYNTSVMHEFEVIPRKA